MEFNDYIAIISILATVAVAAIGGIYTIMTNTKKFELSEQYKSSLFSWYDRTVSIIMNLKYSSEHSALEDKRAEYLPQLSAQIEIGRFYFPNVQMRDNYGKDNPVAYRGYRHAALQYLIYIYDIYESGESGNLCVQLEDLERKFTSVIFEVIDPPSRIKNVKKYTGITVPDDIGLSFHSMDR